jgi:hypothetical protein
MKNFELNENMSYETANYYLLNNGNVLEVARENFIDGDINGNPFEMGMSAANYGVGKDEAEAYERAFEKLSIRTYKGIMDKVADVLVSQTGSDNKKELLALWRECNDNPGFKEVLDFLDKNNVAYDDVLLIANVDLKRDDVTVMFIEAKSFENFYGTPLKYAYEGEKENAWQEATFIMENWNHGEVYRFSVYDKNDNDITNDEYASIRGNAVIQETINDYLTDNKLSVVAELGDFYDIDDCREQKAADIDRQIKSTHNQER